VLQVFLYRISVVIFDSQQGKSIQFVGSYRLHQTKSVQDVITALWMHIVENQGESLLKLPPTRFDLACLDKRKLCVYVKLTVVNVIVVKAITTELRTATTHRDVRAMSVG
jgi:hypothetical protein